MIIEDKFKVGVEVKVDQTSLNEISKQVERSVREATQKGYALGLKKAGVGAAGVRPAPIAGGTATARSVRGAAEVSSKDFANAVKALVASNRLATSKFGEAAQMMADAMDKLRLEVQAQARARARGVVAPPGPPTGARVRGAPAPRVEAARQLAGAPPGRREVRRTGTEEAGPRRHPLERAAEQQAKAVAASLAKLEQAITGLGKLSQIPDLMKRIGLPTAKDVRVGRGAATQVKLPSGEERIITGYFRIAGKEIQEAGNELSKRISDLLRTPRVQERMQIAERTARRDPERAMSILRKEFRDIMRFPDVRAYGGARGFAKGGEALVEIDVRGNKALQDRLKALNNEAAQIALLNKELWNMTDVLEKLRKVGVQVIGSVGLGEERAAEAKILKGEGGAITGARLPVQVRDLAGMILGGRGAMRAARSFQPYQARPLIEGERPRVMGRGEAEAYATGMFPQEMVRHLRTAFVDPRQVPEVSEDMILIDKKAAEKMKMWEPQVTQPLKALADGLEVGQKLVKDQVLGFDIEGQEVRFDIKGAQAEITEIEEIVDEGISAIRIRFKELFDLVTGSKLTTTAGAKGVVRVVEDLAKQFGAPAGTEAMVTGFGSAKRGVLSDVMKMMSAEIAKAAGVSGQEVANHIEEAMQRGGQDLVSAVKQAAEAFGVKGFTGGAQGERLRAMVGELPFMRLKEPRAPGPAEIGTRYLDLPAQRALGLRAGTAKMAQDMQERMARVAEAQKEFIATLRALAGETDVASEHLREMLPEEFKRLPPGVGAVENFADTILDPRFQEALAVRMPTRGGGERLLRMPAIGPAPGMRAGFKTPIGARGAEDIARRFDQMLQVAQNIRVAEGRIPPDVAAGGDIAKEAAFRTKRAIEEQVEALSKLNLKSEQGAAAADNFVNSLLPLIDALNVQLTEPIEFYKLGAGGARQARLTAAGGAAGAPAGEFIRGAPTAERRLFALRDVLAGRTALRGRGTENIPTTGEVFGNFELLQKVMDKLGITVEKDADSIENLYKQLERLEEGLVGMLAAAGMGGGKKPSAEIRRAFAEQMGAGLGLGHKELTAVQFRTDVGKELALARDRLQQLAAAGQNVDEALAAVDRLASMQTDVAKIPRDAVFLNKQDYDNLVQATMAERGIGRAEAERRMARPGLLHRFPTTGGASFLATRALRAPEGLVPPGKIGVAGPAALGGAGELATMLKPLRELEGELYQVIKANQGQGEAAAEARAELDSLVPALEKLNQLFLATALNLDFDGDKISWLADTATEAGSDIETFTQKVEKGGVSFQQMMLNIIGKVKGGAVGGVSEYAELFGKVAKGRKGELKRAVIAPATGEMAEFEAMAHIAGKKSVGLLTDVFNKMMVAITDGSRGAGDAFATGMEYIMLNINKSLAQKGGEGGVAGPLEFVRELKMGNLQKIFRGMRAGGPDIFGEMGEYNKQLREQMTKGFQSAFLRKGEAGLKEIAKAEDIEKLLPKEITFENYINVVEKMVNALDLEALITRMFEMMKKNMVRALGKQGLTGPEITEALGEMLGPGGPGLDIDRMLGQLAPGYLMTRQKQLGELKGEPPMEQARRVLQLLPKELAIELESMSKEFDLEAQVDPKAQAAQIANTLLAFYKSIRESFTTVFKAADFAKITGGIYNPEEAARISGAYIPEEIGGKAGGEVFVGFEARIRPFLQAIQELYEVSGGASRTAAQMAELAKQIKTFGVTIAHEQVHQANKRWGEALNSVVRSLQSSSTAVGREAPKLFQALSGKLNIKHLMGEAKKWREVAEDVGDVNLPEAQQAKRKLYRATGEELLALQTDPEAFQRMLQEAGVAQEAIDELKTAFDALRKAQPDLIDEAMTVTRQAAAGIVKGFMQGLEEAPTRGIEGEAARLAAGMGDFPGRELYKTIDERLAAQEKIVLQGTGALGLPRVAARGGKLELPEPMEAVPFAEEFPTLTAKIKDILEAARQGFPDIGQLTTGEREITQAAGDLRQSIAALERDPGAGVGRGAGHRTFMKVLQEFHQAVSLSFLNRARDLQRQIGEIRQTGEAEKDPGRLRDLLNELAQTVKQHEDYLAATLRPRGRGRGTVTSHIVTREGDLVPAAMEAGIQPSAEALQAQLAAIAGKGKEGAIFMKQMGNAIEYAQEEMQTGRDITKAWTALMEALSEEPAMFHTNLVKVAEILAKISRHLGFVDGRLSDSAQGMMELVKHAKALGRAIEGKPVRSAEELAEVIAGAPKQARVAAAIGKGGVVQSVEAQYREAEKIAREYQKRLQKLIVSPEYRRMGAPKEFEPMMKDIIDPTTGKTIQRIRIEAKRMGKQVVVSMKDASNAGQQFGNQMRSALRRVVQWGFASGIVYGTIRAFRNLVQVVTEVQNKIMQLQKVMDVTITDFVAMQDAAVGMAKSFGIAIEDVLDGMVVYGQQGLKMNEIMERTNATLLAVNVTTLSATDATEALTAAHKVFGDTVSSSAEFVDAWGAVAAKHAITAKDLADAVKRSGAAAGVAGVNFEDFLGIVTAIGAVTRQTGKEIATSTKFMFRAMRRPTAQKELGRAGIPSLLPTGDLRPAMDILADVAKMWDKLSRAQQINMAQAMAGIRHYNSFIVLMNNFEEAQTASIDATNSQGFAVRKNALAMQTFAKQMQVLRETMKSLALQIGKSLLGPITGIVKAISSVVDILNKVPAPIVTAIAALAALGVAGVRTADLIVDSWDAIFGYGGMAPTKTLMKKKGLVKSFRDAMAGVGRGLRGGAEAMLVAPEAPEALGRLGTLAAKARVSFEGFGKGVLKATGATRIFGTAVAGTAASIAAATVASAALVAAGVLLYKMFQKWTKTGKDLDKEMEVEIGRSRDFANQLRGMKGELDKIEVSFSRVSSAMGTIEDTEALRDALNASNFKSAAIAARKYSDTMADVGKALVTIDPANLQGISETGEYIVGIGEAYGKMTVSAIDARNAITAALQTKVLEQYARDIQEAVGWWKKLKQAASDFIGLKADFSLAAELKENEIALRKVLERRDAIARSGSLEVQTGAEVLKLTQRRAELEQEILSSAIEIKKIMDEMPKFESLEMAAKMLGPKTAKAIEAAIPSGVFGRGATVESVMFGQLAKTAGLGGIVGPRTAASPAELMGAFLEKGVVPEIGRGAISPAATGDIAVIGKEVAMQLVENMGEGLEGADLQRVARGAQTLIADVNRETGEAVYKFADGFTGTIRDVTIDALDEAIQQVEEGSQGAPEKIGYTFARVTREAVEEMAEETERILNLVFVGAMAGIRMPKTGMPDLGAARREDLTAEQRALEAVGREMQRLSDIQNEMTQITREYSETVLDDVEGSYKTQSKSASALKAFTMDMVTLVTQLQEEAFNLAVIGHYQNAIEALGISMEQAAQAARDARIEEEARAEFLVETSGALKGLSEIPQVDFGKTMRELTGTERLAVEVPGFKGYLNQLRRAGRERETMVQQLADIRKQRERFGQIVESMQKAGERLTKKQASRIRENIEKGLSTGQIETIAAIEKSDDLTVSVLEQQLSVEEKMLDALHNIVRGVYAASPEEKQQLKEQMRSTDQAEEVRQLLKAQGAGPGGAQRVNATLAKVFGLVQRREKEETPFALAEKVPDAIAGMTEEQKTQALALRKDLVNILNASARMGERIARVQTGRKFLGAPVRGLGPTGLAEAAEIGGEKKYFAGPEQLLEEQRRVEDALLGMAGIASATSEDIYATSLSSSHDQEKAAMELSSAEESIAKSKETQARLIREAYAKFHEAELKVIAGIEQSSQELMAKDPGRIAVAASNLVNTLDSIILDFKKTEALEYEKIKSDLEGPFARVGRPGFKTEFEQRMEDLEKQRMRPIAGGMEGYRQFQKDLASIEFDEKEARIKQAQDKEVAALRVQQQQAERLRQAMADALFGGQLEGAPELQNLARQYMSDLTDQLAASEQAEMRGGKLKFRGVPGLERAAQVRQQIATFAQEKAREATAALDRQVNKESITDPLGRKLDEQTGYLRQMAEGEGMAVLPSGARRGTVPTVGRTGYNIQAAIRDSKYGDPNATSGALISSRGATPGTPGAERVARGEAAPEKETAKMQEAIASSLEAFSAKIDEIVDIIASLGEVGGKVDDATAAVRDLQDSGIDIKSMPEVVIANAAEIGADLADTARTIGAQVTDNRTILDKLSTVIDPDGLPVEDQLEEFGIKLTQEVQVKIDEVGALPTEISNQVIELRQSLEDEKARTTGDLGTINAHIERIDTKNLEQDSDIKQLKKVSYRADENAKTALARK